MGHEGHHHAHEEKPLGLFASPLNDSSHGTATHSPPSLDHSSDLEHQKAQAHDPNQVPFDNMDCTLHDNPAFHRHAEATTSELFYDLFFVANLTTFTSMQEINDSSSLKAYIGFFSLLWLTWYQVSLYDVRFSTDSVFERCAKAIHFGVMVGFAVIGPQWNPGQEVDDYRTYRAFGLILMVSRITLFAQYTVTMLYAKKYRTTLLPLCLVMASTFVAALIYGALTPAFPGTKTAIDQATGEVYDVAQKSNVYIAWYVVGICEIILTVTVSCVWRVISFKGTHMVQRMSLLTLIILGEGIIVICKSISKIVKNYYLWTAPVVGQIIAAIIIIYLLYMLYFDRLREEHFGSIKQQMWSFLHFPLHTVLVLVLQGVSLLVIWRQAVSTAYMLLDEWAAVDERYLKGNVSALEYAEELNATCWLQVFDYLPKGMEASDEKQRVSNAVAVIAEGLDWMNLDDTNATAVKQYTDGMNELTSATLKTMFDTFSVSLPKKKKESYDGKVKTADLVETVQGYYNVFELVVCYVFIAGGLALLLTTFLGFLSLPKKQRRVSEYIRLAFNAAAGLGLCLIALIRYNETRLYSYMESSWMTPTLCLVLFFCVIANHIRIPGKKAH